MNARLATTAVLLLALAGCSEGAAPQTHGDPVESLGGPPPTSSAPAAPTATATATSATTMRIPVYYLGGTASRPRLYREFRSVARTTGVVRAAVDAMLHLAPLDSDYGSMWPAATTVLGVSTKGSVATVDLSHEARGVTTGSASERASLQQLVHTVTAAAPSITSVQLHVDGAAPATLWGHISTSHPISRAPQVDTLAAVWVAEPGHHASVHRTFTVTGTATVFEATVTWAVTRPGKTAKLAEGFVNATAGGPARGDYTVTVTLPAGTTGDVVFTAWEASAEDGSVTSPDSKTYKVT
jgi:spore germination protein GerM